MNERDRILHRAARLGAAALVLAVVGACGGGTDGTGRVADPIVTTSGVMARGSVVVNGTTFDADRATVFDDRGRGANELANGMVVRLRGRSADGVTGTADRIDVENELRASIVSIDAGASPPRFVAAGTTVFVDDDTTFAQAGGLAALAPGTRVEVHGLRDAAGTLRATRVEVVGPGAGADELRGRITALDAAADRLTLNGTVTVDYANASFAPGGAGETALAIGALVEVRGTLGAGGTFTAAQLDIEALEDAAFDGGAGDRQELEGFVVDFAGHPGTFTVGERTVRTTGDTEFYGGMADDLDVDTWVEVEGALDAQGAIVADHVYFRRTRIVLQGLATAVDVPGRTLGVLAQTVHVDDLTRFIGPPPQQLSAIVPGVHCVDVRASLAGARIVAERVRRLNMCQDDRVQARVLARDQGAFTLLFLDNLLATFPPDATFTDDGQPLTRPEFFARIVPAAPDAIGSLVRVHGTFAAGTLDATSAALVE